MNCRRCFQVVLLGGLYCTLGEFLSRSETAVECLGVRLIRKEDTPHIRLVRRPVRLAFHLLRVVLEESNPIHIFVWASVVGCASDSFLVGGFCLAQLIHETIALYQIGVTSAVIGIEAEALPGFCDCFIILSEHAVDIAQVHGRFGVPRIELSPQLADLVSLLDLPVTTKLYWVEILYFSRSGTRSRNWKALWWYSADLVTSLRIPYTNPSWE